MLTGRAISPASRLVHALDRRDWAAVAELVTEDLEYVLPQSREHTRGREAYLRFNQEFPGDWHLEVLRSLADEGTAMVWFRFCDGPEHQDAFAVHHLRDGRVARITEYWPDPYDPPAGRAHLVQRWSGSLSPHPGPLPTSRGATTLVRDGRDWTIGGTDVVDWIAHGCHGGLDVTSAVPPVYEAYATVHVTYDDSLDGAAWDRRVVEHEQCLVRLLVQHTGDQPWWLGFLETGIDDVVFPQAPRVRLYADWPYVLARAGPEQALGWRRGRIQVGDAGALPDLFFPQDRSWLVSGLWDDGWVCLGGSAALVGAVVATPELNGHRVTPTQDVLPPGLERET